jgi:glycosyltransferase involved in cell wall biosynthesis
LRVLLTVPSLDRDFGGPIVKARELTTGLRSRGHDVILAGAGSYRESETYVLKLGRIGRFHGTPVPRTIDPLRRLIGDADVVHAIGFRDPVGTLAVFEAGKRRIPVVLEPAGMLQPRLRSFRLKSLFDRSAGRRVLDRSAVVIATSSVEAADLSRQGLESIIRPNGLDIAKLLPLPERGLLRSRFSIPEGAPLVVTLARIGAIKGLLSMASALAELPRVWWLLAGPDAFDGTLEAVREKLRRSHVDQRAVILPMGIWGEEKRAALADADVFCLPSEYESFGSAAVEAAATGVPVVVTEGCGAKDVLSDSAATVVPEGSPSELAAAIEELISRTSEREPDGSLIRSLEWSRIALLQEEIYEGILKPVGPSRRGA